MKRGRVKIYETWRHLLLTVLFIIDPFIFFLLFSRMAHITTSKLFLDILTSFYRLMLAYLIAAFLGWLCAVLFYRGKRAAVALPIFDVLQSFPTFALLPLATLTWGPSNFTVIFFLLITIIWPIFFSTLSSLKLIKRDWVEVAKMSRLSGFNYLKKFIWPVSVPGLITGSIIGLGEGWEAIVATEMIIRTQNGLGNFFQVFSHNSTITSFGILGFLILIFTINKLVWIPLMEWSHSKMEE